ncbi:MAG: glycogen/starch synthase [Candidatus Kaiserbacteria bacterium]|nr:glycogen/starch synthase [Candidatus Kaiserbacteria bacterium]
MAPSRAANVPLVVLTVELRLHEILHSFRGGLGDLMGHEFLAMPGIYVCYGYPRDYKTHEPIDYLSIPGAKRLDDLAVDIYMPSVRRTVRIIEVRRNSSRLLLICPEAGMYNGRAEGDVLYASDHGISLEQSAFFGRAAHLLLKQLKLKPEIVSVQEWRAGCNAIPGMRDDPYFHGTRYLFVNHTARREALPTFDAGWFNGLAIDRRHYDSFVVNGRIDPDRGCIACADLVAGVSEEHAEVLRETHPGFADKIIGLLNGVDRASILSPRIAPYRDPTAAQLRDAHFGDKRELLEMIKAQTGVSWSVDDHILGAVRRLTGYKNQQPLLEPVIRQIVASGSKILIGGVPHESDECCQGWVATFREWMRDPAIAPGFAYLPDYSEHIRLLAAQGSDTWLECPLPRNEACGTSNFIAWANGNPVIATCGGGAREYGASIDPTTATGDTLFIEPYDSATLLARIIAMRDWYQDPTLWPKLRRNAFEKGRQTDMPYMVARYEDAFRRLRQREETPLAA